MVFQTALGGTFTSAMSWLSELLAEPQRWAFSSALAPGAHFFSSLYFYFYLVYILR